MSRVLKVNYIQKKTDCQITGQFNKYSCIISKQFTLRYCRLAGVMGQFQKPRHAIISVTRARWDTFMHLDIHTTVRTAFFLSLAGIVICLIVGVRSIRGARYLRYFKMRRERALYGWRLILTSLFLCAVAVLLNSYAEPLIYKTFPPTATVTLTPTTTLTPTITLTPTETLTPTITLTPAVSDTPTATITPSMPMAIGASFSSTVTPNPEAIFSPLQFALSLDSSYQAQNVQEVFTIPFSHIYAVFSYDKMVDGAQWSAIWYRQGKMVYYESKPWDGGTGGYGFADWNPKPEDLYPGDYEVQIFVGMDWKISGFFTVEGNPPQISPTQIVTPSPAQTSGATLTPQPTAVGNSPG